MAKRSNKPPISRKKVLKRLGRARDQRLRVKLSRWIPDASRLDGFVVGIGRRWTAVAWLDDAMHLDGWCLVRIKDIQSVSIQPVPDSFAIRVLKARGEWPPTAPAVDLDTTAEVLRSAAAATSVVAIHAEFHDPYSCWAGAVTSVGDGELELLEVSPEAFWRQKPRVIDLDDVTRVDIGGYEEALSIVAGQPPPR